ncbi:MAG: hypothetical protein CM15mP54_27100 [Paracoccaceae bacterium]|nr:MAG: hypothetical protein CM15mP54_27100 [Paracoccaceae bacterium]
MSDRGLLPGLDVSRETYSRLKDYEKLLLSGIPKLTLFLSQRFQIFGVAIS